MNIQYLPLDWNTYHTYARRLAASILSHMTPTPNQIIAISRGGLPLGHLLSDSLRIPISTITIQSYSDVQTQGEVKVTEPLKAPIKGKIVLLVDDVADSGKTLIRALSYLKKFSPKNIIVVTMFYKPRSEFRPDFFAEETTKWILFPYEPTEMILSITRSMEKTGASKKDIQDKLHAVGYNDEQIRFVRKYHL